ncbi:MAG: GNAT family N-acetyltransferase [Synechococcus sp.]|nr:GNAT family N-acetyltransferase [Synechococcus sp.]
MNVRKPLAPLRQALLMPDDLRACLDLDRASLGGLWTASQWQVELADQRRPGVGLWRGERLLAMACGWLVLDELHITLVAVALEQRRRGLGGRVLEALLEIARGSGALHATLEVAPGNGAAVALYRRCGFRDAGVRRGYYRNGDDALIQWVGLGSTGAGGAGCG